MYTWYDGSHSITFGDGTITDGKFVGVNTWKDWHLIPDSRPVVTSPEIFSKFVTIPGRNGSYDMSEYLTGAPVYNDRSGSWTFIVDNDHEGWTTIKNRIFQYLHGKRKKCVLEDEAGYYYEGRFTVSEWKNDANNSMVTIKYVLEPYKYHIAPTDYWIWDIFNFEQDYTNVTVEKML